MMMTDNQTSILRVRDLKVYYPVRTTFFSFGGERFLRAVDGVSFDVRPGEILGLVGESGCGKSSLGRAVMRLNEPTSGGIEILGTDFLSLQGKELRLFRKNIQMVFQDPYASLNPRMTVFEALQEPLKAHFSLSNQEISKKVSQTLERVGLSQNSMNKYPHEFSGGQRQRVAIARALILDPKILVADEPVSSLDVSVQAQVLNLLKEIQAATGLSMIFISHNLSVIKYISNRISVMYLGKIVETANQEDLFKNPLHPYTQALISAVPIPDPKIERTRKRIALAGELPSAENPPVGCAFNTRCPRAVDKCLKEKPILEPSGKPSHQVACFEAEKV
jgi:oligopeptide/dipeptide ABC transporter ATP-binding protein